jgi:hypothetical protein
MAADETYDVLLRVKSEGDEQLKQLSRALVTVQQTAKAAGNQLVQTNNQVSGSTDRLRFGFQNLGFQAQDFAVQVAGGTTALRAFSQQMPQAIGAVQGMLSSTSKLGAFLGGPWGVALGVASAVMGPLIAKLFDTGEAAEDATEKMARLRGEVSATAEAAAKLELDTALKDLGEANQTAGRGAALTARAIEQQLPKLRAALTEIQAQNKLASMGLDALYQKQKAGPKAKVDRTAEKQAAKDAKEAADLIEAANDGVLKSFQEMEAAAKAAKKAQDDFTRTLEQAANPALAFADDLTKLYDLMDKGAISQQALDLAVQKSMQNLSDAVGKLNEDPQAAKIAARQKEAAAEVVAAWQSVGDSISDAFGQLVAKTSSVRQVVRSLVADILAQLAKIAITKFVARTFATAAAANGKVFDNRGLVPFAKGGVVAAPTIFPFAGGTGLMGEAGPEAIMPLQRDAQGKLGVAAAPVSINVINNAGAAVSVQETAPGKIDIIIARAVEASRMAIASDFRRGGSDVSRSVERAYGVNRGAGAF